MVTIAALGVLVIVLLALYGFNANREGRSKSALQANRGAPVSVTTESVQSSSNVQARDGVGSLIAVHQVPT